VLRDRETIKGGRIRRFITQDVWDMDPRHMPAMKAAGVRTLRAIYMMVRGFMEDDCPLHASALTLSTLMAIVPILALSLALARGFGDADTAKARIREAVSEWTATFQGPRTEEAEPVPEAAGGQAAAVDETRLTEQIDRLLEGAFERVESINFATLGSVGLILLLWMVTQVLGRVESAFNRVWGVTQGRSIWRRFTDYLSVLIVLPLLIIAASSIPVADLAMRHMDEYQANFLRALISSKAFRHAAVGAITVMAFTFFIMFMPNTAVRFRAALLGGILSGVLFLIWMKICAAFQIYVAGYGRIYGGFAVVPVLLAWVFVSWEIVLFGAEAAFAAQNCSTYRMEQDSLRASVQARLLLALSVVLDAARAMKGDAPDFDAGAFSKEHRVPVRFLNETLHFLVKAGLLAEVSERSGRYVLLRAPDSLLIEDIADNLLDTGTGPSDIGLSGIDQRVQKVVVRLTQGMHGALDRATVADLMEGRIPSLS
jgi:membrane protein